MRPPPYDKLQLVALVRKRQTEVCHTPPVPHTFAAFAARGRKGKKRPPSLREAAFSPQIENGLLDCKHVVGDGLVYLYVFHFEFGEERALLHLQSLCEVDRHQHAFELLKL